MPLLLGGIVIWSGAIQDIPTGWRLCDGTNGTPDLRNRFIIGAGDIYNVGDVGGSANAILPSHQHPNSVTSTAPTHTHSWGYNTGGGYYPYLTGTNGGTLNTSTVAAHTHTGTINAAGGTEDGVGKNLPPYYALCYIQQIE
jgi:hypothetical protein